VVEAWFIVWMDGEMEWLPLVKFWWLQRARDPSSGIEESEKEPRDLETQESFVKSGSHCEKRGLRLLQLLDSITEVLILQYDYIMILKILLTFLYVVS